MSRRDRGITSARPALHDCPDQWNRRGFVAAACSGVALSLAGCTGSIRGADEVGDEESAAAGRIEPLGNHLATDSPMYTYGHVSEDGRWAVLGSFPASDSLVASTLYDLTELDAPRLVHELDSVSAGTRSNDVKFDALRDGLYYRSQEADEMGGSDGGNGTDREGFEVVDFGWNEGTPEEPTVVGTLETPESGVHKLTTHPDEPVLYLVDVDPGSDVGVLTVDVSEPTRPEIVETVGPPGGCHDVEYDPRREVLHAAYIFGQNEGYVIYDLDDPYRPGMLGQFEYTDESDYETIGEPGFERCHQAHPDPDRDLTYVGDELDLGIPGGKHVFDVGWDEGSLEEPVPIGFTHAPDAREMDTSHRLWWTTHFHDVVHFDDDVLLVDGGYRQGAWVCNVTDPRDPRPTERFATTVEGEDPPDHSTETPAPATPPFAWSAVYNEERDFVLVSDSVSGVHTFSLTSEPARGDDGGGPDGHFDLDTVFEE